MANLDLTLTAAAQKISAGELSPVDLVDSTIAQIEKVDGAIGAFSAPTFNSARKEATQAADDIKQGKARSPLHGIPIAVKALIDRAGVESTSSSRTQTGRIPDVDAAVVQKLEAAGAILIGQVHTHEY